MNKGFTLVELLVVVLIIGILSAVALPQYQKAVEKSRMTEALILVKKIVEAQKIFYMSNGRYASFEEMETLDLQFPKSSTIAYSGQHRYRTKDFAYSCQGTGATEIAVAQRVNGNGGLGTEYYFSVNSDNMEKVICYAYPTANKISAALCQEFQNTGIL